MIAHTLMLTTRCSARCSHCPFGAAEMPVHHLPVARALEVVRSATPPLVVVSGGEPFEHPEIGPFLQRAAGEAKHLRLATGGHIDLSPFVAALRRMTNLEGVSLGTDVLSGRAAEAGGRGAVSAREIWFANLRRLQDEGIGYSLTLTWGEDLGDPGALLEEIASHVRVPPDFIYLRLPAGPEVAVRRRIEGAFPGVAIVEDDLSPSHP
jgi:hypothetical protein